MLLEKILYFVCWHKMSVLKVNCGVDSSEHFTTSNVVCILLTSRERPSGPSWFSRLQVGVIFYLPFIKPVSTGI